MTIKYFVYPFGVSGDLLTIPDPAQVSGVVSYQIGFGIDYQLVDTDPSSLNIPRNQFNQLMNDITGAIQQIQQNGFPIHITSAMNDGSPYAYSKNSYVRATDGNVYYSLINSNTDVPPTSNWQLAGSEVLQYFNFATDTGTANHYVIAPSPPITAYADGDFILLKPAHANTGACDINVNGLGAISIKTMANTDPLAGMIIPTGVYILVYVGGVFILTNPYLGSLVKRINTVIITTSGTYTPSAGLIQAQVDVLAGGGGGGGANALTRQGGGGQAGSFSRSILTASTIGGSQTVTIGSGGVGGLSSGGNGGNGGNSSFGSLVTANGGNGGHGNGTTDYLQVLGGSGNNSGTGDIAVAGQAGLSSGYATSSGPTGMMGGSTLYGAGGAPVTIGTAGNPGQGNGAGGGGAAGNGAFAGGNGAPGICVITEYLSQ